MKLISLFAGAGGLDLGFKNSGFNTVFANEYDKKIFPTYKINFPETHLDDKSIRDINEKELPTVDGLIGGPPCQSFSEAGAGRGTKDPRGQLFWDYIRILNEVKPKFFVAENVSGLMSQKHRGDLESFINAFNSAGYNVSVNLYNASSYGVPQDRERIIMVGYRQDLNINFKQPEPDKSKITLRDAIYDLGEPCGTKCGAINKNSKNNHEFMLGGFSSMFMSRNRVRAWDEQSFTILATARQVPLHPSAPKMIKIEKDKYKFDENALNKYRRLSVREAARIQTFPDDFKFIYSKIEDGYKMIGNAVPVVLAERIAQQIKKDLF